MRNRNGATARSRRLATRAGVGAAAAAALLLSLQPDAGSTPRAQTGPAGFVQQPSSTVAAESTTTSSTLPLVTTAPQSDPEAGVPPMAELESPLFPPPFPVPAPDELTAEQLAADGRDPSGKIIALSPELAAVPMDSNDLGPLQSDLQKKTAERTTQRTTAERAQKAVDDATAHLAATHLSIDRAKLAEAKRTTALKKATALHSQLAADRYMNAQPIDLTISIMNNTAASLDRRLTLTESILRNSHAETVALSAASKEAQATLQRYAEDVTTYENAVKDAEQQRGLANMAITALDGEIGPLTTQVDGARRTAAIVGVDLTGVTLDAYWRASKEALRRGCRLPWQFLAGIGKAETTHGTGTGGHVNAEGQMTRPDVGIPLDGTNNTQAIADSDDGLWDTDPNVERAFGAMQFIPWSWARYRIDGNGDGIRDANNFYDATYAAVGYLCRFSPITTESEMYRAAFQYNHSSSYASKVTGYAMSYARAKLPSVKGAEPAVSSAGSDSSVTSVPVTAADIASPEELSSSSTTAPTSGPSTTVGESTSTTPTSAGAASTVTTGGSTTTSTAPTTLATTSTVAPATTSSTTTAITTTSTTIP